VTDPSRPDPVRERRARIARLVEVGQRVGYSLFGIAIGAFVYGFVAGFDGVVGSIVLAPAIVFGYAVKAAERDDRARGL